MFEDLRNAFKEALDNFNKELNRDQVSEAADKLLVGMRNEIVDEKAAVAGLEDQIEKATQQIDNCANDAAAALRPVALARNIHRYDTLKLPSQYVAKSDIHREVLRKKVAALEEELSFRRTTLEGMMGQFEEAREKRSALKATTGRSGARESISAANDLFAELDRMADKIEGTEAEAEAAEAFSEFDFDEGSEYRVELDDEPPEELDVDAALEELKRRMQERDEG